jgi:predicted membrane protein
MNPESDYQSQPADDPTERRKPRLLMGVKTDIMAAIVVMLLGCFFLLRTNGLLPPGLVISFWGVLLLCVGVVQLFTARGAMKGWALILLVAGLVLQMNAMGLTRIHMRNLWPVFVIGAGGAMLWQAMSGGSRSWKILEGSEPFVKESVEAGSLNLNYVFSGTDRKIRTRDFKGGEINAVFGGFKLDLTRAEMQNDKTALEANVVFGTGEIIVPENWLVIMETSGVFGTFEDKSRHYQPDAAQPLKTLVVRGSAVFGTVVVRND